MNNFDIIVVGGGIAGLTSAAYGVKNNKNVLLCECSNKVGGLVGGFQVDGFVFDTGIRAIENSGTLIPMLNELNIKLPLVKDRVRVQIGDNSVDFTCHDAMQKYEELLIEHFPNDATDIKSIVVEMKKTIKKSKVLYEIENPLFKDCFRDREYIFKELFPWMFQFTKEIKSINRMQTPINEYLKKFTSNKQLIDMITQHFFTDTPAFFAMSYFYMYTDYYYPTGGTNALPFALSNYIRNNGGTIKCNSRINRIDVNEKYITTEIGQKYHYKKLIWCADSKSLWQSITNYKNTKSIQELQNKIKINKGNNSVLSIYLALDLPSSEIAEICSQHMFFTPYTNGLSSLKNNCTWQESLKNILKYTTYEISCPSSHHESLAPPNKCSLVISTLFEYGIAKTALEQGYYQDLKRLCTDEIIEVISHTLIKNLKDKILFSKCSTPLTIEKYTRNSSGAITGWAFTDGIPAQKDLTKVNQSVLTPFKDIFQAGQWCITPSGVPTSIITGKIALQKALK